MEYMIIDNNGVMRDVDDNEVVCYEKKIDLIFEKFNKLKRKNSKLSMTIYIHGGLNSFKDTVDRVKNTYKRFLKENQYPVFICWKSDLLPNYVDYLFAIRNGERNMEKAIPTSPFIFVKDVARSIARTPISYLNNNIPINWFVEIKDEKKITDEIEKSLESEQIESKFNLHKKNENYPPEGFKAFMTISGLWDFVTLWNPAKLLTTPLADGFGKGSWRSMLRRTDLILNSQIAFDGMESKKLDECEKRDKSETAASYFLKELRKDKYKNLKKTLIAHSMGTIVANNILTMFPDINFDKVVYMAAACKIKDVKNSVVPWLRKEKTRRFYNLTLNPYIEIHENVHYDFIPRGSLLIWIDTFLEDINSFEDRTTGYWCNIIRSAKVVFPKEIRQQVHLTRFGIKDKSPQVHGEFDEFNFWDERFWSLKKVERFLKKSSKNVNE